jgi:regulator of sigma E protease
MLLGDSLKITVFEGGLTLEKELDFSGVPSDGKPEELYQKLGLKVYQPTVEPVIGKVLPGDVADKAGLKAGDTILFVAKQPVSDWEDVVKTVSEHPGIPLTMSIMRGDHEMTLQMVPKVVDGPKGKVGKIGAGVKIDKALFQSLSAEMRYGVVPAFSAALAKTWEMSSLTLKMIGEMIVGRTSVENLSGPIGIAQYAKQSAAAGFGSFLKFLGLISVSLGVLNLLPVPVLDGGHLFYYAIEAVRGKPLTERMEAIGQRVGLALIFAMMAVAVYNDLARLAAN